MRRIPTLLTSLAVLALTATAAVACHVGGYVLCDSNGQPLSGIRVDVVATDGTDYSRYAVSNEFGRYDIALLCEPHCYRLTVETPNGETVVSPASGYFDFCADAATNYSVEAPDWRLNSLACPQKNETGCWLTAGGAKFSSITGTDLGDFTKVHNWGGNVYPGCSPYPSDGGNWNDIDNVQRLHFKGTNIEVVRCGNIDGIPPGSTSPVTPVNFIEFQGTGTLKGIKGNKADFGTVYFWAHCEDRNEPGSAGQHDGAGKDRYFLNVFTNPADPIGSSVMLVDVDGDPSTVDPVTITDGNMQLHASSCESSLAALRNSMPEEGTAGSAHVAFLATPYPNPGSGARAIRFGLPTSSAVTLRVFDAAGRLVRTLENGVLPAGEYRSAWDLRDDGGATVATGVYFVRLAAGTQVFSRTINVTP
jgi:hypothetical protein